MTRGEARPNVPSLGSTLAAGIAGRCPACHRGKLYSGYLALAPRCENCGLDYSFADSGDGPAVFVILVTGFVVTGLALLAEIFYAPPYWLHAVLWGSLAILLPLVLLRSFKGALIALQFRHKAEESKFAE
ncbi:MAG TPA: DUF983 domain-containing protein [Methyloceanibacter sp.]|jgi:uncharacterized protein (DUF983 family)|nr:DUF983 domain-containing protein [Methyloceanibacter sp.]